MGWVTQPPTMVLQGRNTFRPFVTKQESVPNRPGYANKPNQDLVGARHGVPTRAELLAAPRGPDNPAAGPAFAIAVPCEEQ